MNKLRVLQQVAVLSSVHNSTAPTHNWFTFFTKSPISQSLSNSNFISIVDLRYSLPLLPLPLLILLLLLTPSIAQLSSSLTRSKRIPAVPLLWSLALPSLDCRGATFAVEVSDTVPNRNGRLGAALYRFKAWCANWNLHCALSLSLPLTGRRELHAAFRQDRYR